MRRAASTWRPASGSSWTRGRRARCAGPRATRRTPAASTPCAAPGRSASAASSTARPSPPATARWARGHGPQRPGLRPRPGHGGEAKGSRGGWTRRGQEPALRPDCHRCSAAPQASALQKRVASNGASRTQLEGLLCSAWSGEETRAAQGEPGHSGSRAQHWEEGVLWHRGQGTVPEAGSSVGRC